MHATPQNHRVLSTIVSTVLSIIGMGCPRSSSYPSPLRDVVVSTLLRFASCVSRFQIADC
eukprot:5046840-Pyramimonas_sp.AAC.1